MKGQEAFHPIPGRDAASRPWRAALLPRLRPDLVQRLPEPQTTVAGGELGVHLQAVFVAQPEEQLTPTLGALAKAVLDRQQCLLAIGIGADDDQQALAVVVEPRREIDAVGPDVDETPPREVATLPALVLLLPSRHQPAHRRGREARRVGAQERRQGLLELAGRDALQIEPGQQLFDVPGPPKERRQDLRGEADALAIGAVAAVAELRPAHRDRANPGLNLALGRVPITDHAAPTMRVLELGVRAEKSLDLGLDHLLQHPPRPIPQHQQQRIIGDTRPWPRQTNNGIPLHGVSFRVTSNITKDTPPQPSSTKFEHSSAGAGVGAT
jgi:hypothetical protein